MKDRNFKYKKPGSIPMPHSGGLIRAYKEETGFNGAALARELGVSENAVGDYLRKESMQIGILWKISLALEHNFFQVFADKLPFGPPGTKETALQKLLDEKEARIRELEMEITFYKRVVGK